MNESPLPPEDAEALAAFDPRLGRAAFWSVAASASLLGLSARVLTEDVETGRVPIAMRRFGKRQLPYLASVDVLAFIKAKVAAQ